MGGLERDYLVRLFSQFAAGIRRAIERAESRHEPQDAASAVDATVCAAVDFDPEMLLSLAPESFVNILEVSGTDPRVTEFVARSLLLSSRYYREAGIGEVADLRQSQARAVAARYGFRLEEASVSATALEAAALNFSRVE